jgi:hypothetical protein
MLHSDGAIIKLLPDIINLGIDVIHPLEPLPAADLPAIKDELGEQVTFLGGIDISHAMPGSREDVVAEAKCRIAQLALEAGTSLRLQLPARRCPARECRDFVRNRKKNMENTPLRL